MAADETLRVVMADDWASTPAIIDAVRSFERENPRITIEIEGLPFSQIPDAVRAASDTGHPFDVAQWHAFAAGAQDLAQPVDDLWELHLDANEFVPGAVEDVVWDGRRYGVPLDVNAMVLFGNHDLLADAGVDGLPRTFEALERAAELTTSPDGDVRGVAIAHSSWRTFGWIRAAGGRLLQIDEDGTATVTLDDPGVVEGLTFLSELVNTGNAFPPISRNQSSDALERFRSGQSAMHVSGTWAAAELDKAGVDWEVLVGAMASTPDTGDAGTALGGSSTFVPRASERRETAFAFMQHLIDDEHALRYATEEGRLPARTRLFDDPYFNRPVFRVVEEQLQTATPMKLVAFPEAQRIFSETIDGILTGRVDVGDALSEAQVRVEQTLSEDP